MGKAYKTLNVLIITSNCKLVTYSNNELFFRYSYADIIVHYAILRTTFVVSYTQKQLQWALFTSTFRISRK